MKKTFIYAIAICSAFAAGFTSCSKDDATGTNTIPEGKETYMTVSISNPAGTYAADPNAREDEQIISTVDVFIFDASGILKSKDSLGVADFSTSNGTAVGIKKIKTTTGAKKVYIGVNLPVSVKKTITSLASLNTALSVPAKDLYGPGDGVNGWTAGNSALGYAMGSSIIEKTFVEEAGGIVPEANKISTQVKRFVAKIEVLYGLTTSQIDGGSIGGLYCTIKNRNNSMFLAQNVVSASPLVVKDPNWEGWGTGYTAASFDSPSFYLGESFVSDLYPEAVYVLENTSKSHLQGETTYAQICALFTPDHLLSWDGTQFVDLGSMGGGFYLVDYQGQHYYCLNYGTADELISRNNLTGATITGYGGECYYNIFLGKSQGYNIYRNDYIKATIKSIKGIGAPDPFLNPNNPVETDTNIDVTIDIEPWTVIENDYDL